MELCSKACKVELAQGRAEIEAMPNGSELLSIYTENDIETYRDVLYYVGQVLGGFWVINREGKLELRKWGAEPVQTFGSRHRFSSSFSDFITRYTAVSSTNMKTEMAEYYHLDPDDGLTMNLGVNPLLQFGVEETREELCKNILNDVAVINYVPFDSETIGNPALDLGDVLKFSGGQADAGKLSAVTSMQIKIGGKHSLKGVGKNPRLARAKSKNDKNISGLLNQIEENRETGRIGIHTFTNASSFTVGAEDVKIISIEFAASEEVMAQFFGSVIVDVKADEVERTAAAKGDVAIPSVEVDEAVPASGADADDGSGSGYGSGAEEPAVIGQTKEQTISVELPVIWKEDGKAVAHFTFEFNDEVIEIHQPEEAWHSGKHSILLYYPIKGLIANYRNVFNVYMRISGGSALVDTGGCLASISGQSMGAGEAWDGEIKIEEYIGKIGISGGLKLVPVEEGMVIELTDESTGAVERMEKSNMVTNAVNDILGLNPMGIFYNVAGQYDTHLIWNNELLPICPNMIGGILIYSETLTENVDNVFPSTVKLPVAYASNDVNATANVARGSLNLTESKALDNGYRFVWEFTPSQGNGTIAAVALTSAQGGKNVYGSMDSSATSFLKVMETRLETQNKEELSELFSAVEVDFENNVMYSMTFADQSVILKKKRLPVFSLGLNDMLNDTTNTLLEETAIHCSTFRFLGSYTPYGDFLDGHNGYWYGFSNQGNSSGDATMYWVKIKKDDYSMEEGVWTLSNVHIKAVGSFKVTLMWRGHPGGLSGTGICISLLMTIPASIRSTWGISRISR